MLFFTVSAVVAFMIFYRAVCSALHLKATSRDRKFWAAVPTVGISYNGQLPWIRGAFRSITQSYADSLLGYSTYSKSRDSVFAQPIMGIGAVISLPISQLYILNKSESEVVTKRAMVEGLQPAYTMGDQGIFNDLIHFDVVRRFFRRNTIDLFIDPIGEELDLAFRHHWGTTTTEWTTIKIWDSCSKIVSRASSRAIFGKVVSGNDEFAEHSIQFGRALFGGAAFINALPPLMRPVLGPVLGYSARKHEAACLRIIMPLLEDRLQRSNRDLGPEDKPNDPVQWLIDECKKAGSRHVEPMSMARRLLQLHLMSNFGITYVFVGSILHLYSSHFRDEFITCLRAEHKLVVGNHVGLSSTASFEQLHRLDSAIRESMRISSFPIISFMRVVSPETDGLTLSDGTCIPPGTRIGVPSRAIHRDPSLFSQPLEYDAFRFSRPLEKENSQKSAESIRQSISTVTDSFLAFGYGKHAYPGRWFASQYLKQALTYVISNYDVECVGKSWAKAGMFNMILPPTNVEIQVRRRPREY
ncbi:cytochrome P450 [Xylaria sp. FL1777]|nr:cytochrome P450 [Xylaria sp. FL1777]